MGRRYEVEVDAPPEAVWPLLARPGLWSSWAPHVRGAWGLGSPEIEPGARGVVRLLGVIPVPARILEKQPGGSWAWRVGQVTITHSVEPAAGGSLVAFELSAPAPLQQALEVTYGPLIAVVARNLARVARRRGRAR